MKDQYVGDIGDFANNGLLRYLCGVTGPKVGSPLRLGVVWYFNKDQSNDAAGNRIDYLNISDSNDSRYRECDPVLYDTLRRLVGESLVNGTKRSIGQIENGKILPNSTLYYSDSLNNTPRDKWFTGALEKTAEADIVFLNPDTGIASKIQEKDRKPAHVIMDELALLFRQGKSLIVYQHLGRGSGTWEERSKFLSDRLEQKLKLTCKPRAFQWHHVSGRVYFIVAQPDHESNIAERLEKFLESEWTKQGHFTETT